MARVPELSDLCGSVSDAHAMVDSGATHNFVSVAVVEKFALTTVGAESLPVALGDRSTVVSSSVCTLPLMFCDDGASPVVSVLEYRVLDDLGYDVVLGMDWL